MRLFMKLYDHLIKQINPNEVEIIYSLDKGEVSTGEKRNKLLQAASGDYIAFIDADDWVPDYYVEEILKAIESGPDCVAINGTMTTDGEKEIAWMISKDFKNETIFEAGIPFYIRTTNHLAPVRRELALQVGFKDKKYQEDSDYAAALNPLLKTETKIDKPMYEYRFTILNKLY
jgi:glycosyltransferase involved in cell wall biosynthesis